MPIRTAHPAVLASWLWLAATGCLSEGGGGAEAAAIERLPAGIHAQYRLESSHRGVAPPGTALTSSLVLDWKTSALGIGNYVASKSSPTVDVSKIYVGVDDGQLLALRKDSGAIAWSFRSRRYDVEATEAGPVHYGIHGSPAFDDECVYIGDYSGWLYAIFKNTGLLKWEKKLGGSIGASPVFFDGKIFIAVEYPDPNGRVFVLNANDGSEVYATGYLGHHVHASVSIDRTRGYMFVGANNGAFYCFDFVHKKPMWSTMTAGPIKSTAAVIGDTAYVTSWDYRLYAIAIDDGSVRFTFTAQDIIMSSPSYHEGRVYFGSHDGRVYCVDADRGELLWSFKTGGTVMSSPTIVPQSGVLLVGSGDAHLYMLTLDDGTLRWSAALSAGLSSVPVAVDNTIYVNDDSGIVYHFVEL